MFTSPSKWVPWSTSPAALPVLKKVEDSCFRLLASAQSGTPPGPPPPWFLGPHPQIAGMQSSGDRPEEFPKPGWGALESSPNPKKKSISTESSGEKFRLWHHAKCLQSHGKGGKTISDLTTEVQLKLGSTLRQRVWTGCPCSAIHSDVPLSKVSSLSFTHWSKGPLVWTSNFPTQPVNERELTPHNIGTSAEGPITTQKKKKCWPKKQSSKSNKPSSNREIDSDNVENAKKPLKKKSSRIHNEKQPGSSLVTDPTTQVALLKLSNCKSSKPSTRKNSFETEEKAHVKASKLARSKLRKSGFVVTAVSRYCYDSGDSESEVGEKTAVTKKKKKRKSSAAKKSKRVQFGKESSGTICKIKENDK